MSESVPDVEVEDIRVSKKRGLEMQLRHPMFAQLGKEIGEFFEEHGGENYVEFQLRPPEQEILVVTIRRLSGETPAQQIVKLKEELAELKGRLCEQCECNISHKPGCQCCNEE